MLRFRNIVAEKLQGRKCRLPSGVCNFKDVKIVQIEKEDRRYEVELSNGVDLKFNNSFKLLDVDL